MADFILGTGFFAKPENEVAKKEMPRLWIANNGTNAQVWVYDNCTYDTGVEYPATKYGVGAPCPSTYSSVGGWILRRDSIGSRELLAFLCMTRTSFIRIGGTSPYPNIYRIGLKQFTGGLQHGNKEGSIWVRREHPAGVGEPRRRCRHNSTVAV